MRHYASIPFGGKNITDDIKSECQISERLAENIKLAYGACMPEKLHSLSEKVLQIMSSNNEPSKQITVKYLSEIITARIEEILMAILYEIEESGFGDMLKSGIVVTGGVAETANLSNFIYELSGYRVRTGYPKGHFSNAGCCGIKDASAATSVGLILAAKDELGINCAQACKVSESSVLIETGEEYHEPEMTDIPETEPIYDNPQMETNAGPQIDNEGAHAEPEKKRRNLFEGFKVCWSNTKKRAEEAIARTGEKLDEMRSEEI
jgi:cell division protein FtsA